MSDKCDTFHVRIGERRPPGQDGGSDSDAVLDAVMKDDPRPRGLRSAGHYRNLRGGGRNHDHYLRGRAEAGARMIADIGLRRSHGFDAKTCGSSTPFRPNAHIAMGRGHGGAGDQG